MHFPEGESTEVVVSVDFSRRKKEESKKTLRKAFTLKGC